MCFVNVFISLQFFFFYVCIYIYLKLTVPEEEKNNNDDDRHIKRRQNKSYCQFFLSFLSFSLSSFLLFRLVAHKKVTEAKRRKKQQLIDQHHYRRQPPYAKLSPSCFAIRSLTYIYIIYI